VPVKVRYPFIYDSPPLHVLPVIVGGLVWGEGVKKPSGQIEQANTPRTVLVSVEVVTLVELDIRVRVEIVPSSIVGTPPSPKPGVPEPVVPTVWFPPLQLIVHILGPPGSLGFFQVMFICDRFPLSSTHM